MINPKTVILFTTLKWSGVEAEDGAVGKAGGEAVGAIVGGEVPMDREGVTSPGVKDEDGVEARRVAIVGKGADFGKEVGSDLVGEEASVRPNSEGKSLQKVDGLVEISYISDEKADEDPEFRVSVKDEGKIEKK